jgi:hypothetical protein
MSKREDEGQQRDALLRRLLKSPPLSRAETAEQIRRAKEEATKRTRQKVVSPKNDAAE